MPSRTENLIGQKFTRLTVKKWVSIKRKNKRTTSAWECICDCGNIRLVKTNDLKNNNVKSCGCKKQERALAGKPHLLHGLSKTPEYSIWRGMKRRCSPKCKKDCIENYYNRGIRMAKEWEGYDGLLRFIEHVGKRPSKKYTIDRINNDGNYEPGNVRWATRKTQIKNRRKVARIENFTDEEIQNELIRRKNKINLINQNEQH